MISSCIFRTKVFAFGILENLILYLPNISLVPSLKDSLYRLMFETCFRILFLSHFYIFLPRIIILHLHNFAQETALLLHGRKERGGEKEEVPLSFRVVDIYTPFPAIHARAWLGGGPFKSRYGNHWLVNSLSAINSRCDWFTRGWESSRRCENSRGKLPSSVQSKNSGRRC